MSANFVRFLGIGAQKCASSWLHDILADHPQVAVAPIKELDFFSYRYENGLRWYASQFSPSSGQLVVGETSPSYFHEPCAALRAREYEPSLRIVVSLRDPVERALSQHRHMARLGLLPVTDLTFESALASNPTYVEQGRYHHHLRRWLKHFPREQMHVVLIEDIQHDAVAVGRGLYAFLGVAVEHRSASLGQRSNASYVPRHRRLEGAVKSIRGTARTLGMGGAWQAMGNLGLRRLYRAMNRRSGETALPPPQPETLEALRRIFRPDVEALSDLLQRDLSAWLGATRP